MSRRLLLALAVVALAAPATAQAQTVTVRVTSVLVSIRSVDVGPAGPSKGDRRVFRTTLLNTASQFGKPKGAKVGSDRGTMTFTSAHSVRYAGSAVLPGGTLTIRGPVQPVGANGIRIAVVGGTGRFARATGTLTVGGGAQRAPNVYRLKLPGTVA